MSTQYWLLAAPGAVHELPRGCNHMCNAFCPLPPVPAPGDVLPDLDPAFDSVMVVWDSRLKDVATGESLPLGDGVALASKSRPLVRELGGPF